MTFTRANRSSAASVIKPGDCPRLSNLHLRLRRKKTTQMMTSVPMPSLAVRCQCGAVSQENIRLREGRPLSLCHCDSCRHSTGLLCTSYYPVKGFSLSDSIRGYSLSPQSTRYFCTTCGCHVARSRKTEQGLLQWDVATGVVVASTQDLDLTYEFHDHVKDTKDGGISIWINLSGHHRSDLGATAQNWMAPLNQQDLGGHNDLLTGSCLCGTVCFEITRPDLSSREPRRWLPDLMLPDKTTSDDIKQNPSDIKWWIPNNGSKFLAGTCACRSCRLVSGFEIQTWAFVPRSNIFLVTGLESGRSITKPLDFATLPQGILQTHSSSPNALRDFCGKCGATVFWRENGRPDVIDVSVGLLQAQEGARAESWLEWWTDRVSFSEEVGTGRTGSTAVTTSSLIHALEDGLKASNHPWPATGNFLPVESSDTQKIEGGV